MDVEVADIIMDNIQNLKLTPYEEETLTHIMECRTAALGKHLRKCTNKNCSYEETSYNSCRNRNCPKCLGSKQVEWMGKRINELLPINYSHVVFKVPPVLKDIFRYNKIECYNLLFKSVNGALLEASSTNKKNNVKIGYIALLHTWSQLLNFHPHVHCIVAEGGPSKDNKKWVNYAKNRMFDKEKLGIIFRRHLINNLTKEYKEEKISIDNNSSMEFEELLEKIKKTRNSIYIKSSFGDAAGVIQYLGNFIKKIAISNNRIKSYSNKTVTIKVLDRADGNKIKDEKIDALLFLKRFIFHIVPYKFTKIRYYGFLANRYRKSNLEHYRELLETSGEKLIKLDTKVRNNINQFLKVLKEGSICPCCKTGHLILNTGDIKRLRFQKAVGGGL